MMKSPALLLVDLQKGLDNWEYYGGNRNNSMAESNAARLLAKWRNSRWPIIHVKHNSPNKNSPLHPSHLGNEFKQEVAPIADEVIIEKSVNSAFIGTSLEAYLQEHSIDQIVIVGLTTDHCVSTTVRMAGNLGFETYVVEDATATFDKVDLNGRKLDSQLVHDVTLASLHGEFAAVMNTEEIIRRFF